MASPRNSRSPAAEVHASFEPIEALLFDQVESELAEVEGKTFAAVEERVDRALSKTFGPNGGAPATKKPVQKPVVGRRASDA